MASSSPLDHIDTAQILLNETPLYRIPGIQHKTGAYIRSRSGIADKATHARTRAWWEDTRRIAEEVYFEAVKDAEAKYGDHGPLVSGVVRGHFPADVKKVLRELAHFITEAGDAAELHRKASGARS